jgi:hypothetical protein
VEPVDHHVHRLDDQEEYGRADDDQGQCVVDEIAVGKDRVVDRETEPAEVGLPEQRGDQRVDEVPDQGLDDAGEGDRRPGPPQTSEPPRGWSGALR